MIKPSPQLKYIWSLVRPYRWQFYLALFSTLIGSGVVIFFGEGLKHLVNFGLASEDVDYLNHAALVLLGLVFVLSVVSYGRVVLVSWLGERVMADLRKRVFDHLLKLDIHFFETRPSGDLVSRLTTDTTLIQTVVDTSLPLLLRNVLLLIGGFIMLAVSSLKLTVIILVAVPLLGIGVKSLGGRIRTYSKQSQDKLGDVSAYADEVLREMKTVQLHHHEEADRTRFTDLVESAISTAMKRVHTRGALAFVMILTIFSLVSIVLWVGGISVIHGKLSAGDLAAFVFYALLVAGSVRSLTEVVSDVQRASGAVDRLLDLLAEVPTIYSPDQPQDLPETLQGEITFDGVSFVYPSNADTDVVTDLSITIQPGEKVAIVGQSGAGKSTLFNLLLRFYDPTSGSIKLDGIDIKNLRLEDLRRSIGVIPQDTVLFATSVFNNIRFTKPGASEDEVRAAADAAAASDFIDRLPDGIHTHIGEKGVRLSGGQRQRIALSRAFLKDPRVLLFDEATTGLDPENEALVFKSLQKLLSNRTTLMISHHLSTIQRADRIIVLDKGVPVGIGTHSELLRTSPLYKRLVELEFDKSTGVGEWF